MTITETPPWWHSWWAYLLYASLAVLLLRFYVRLRIQQALEQQKRIARQPNAEQQLNHHALSQTQFIHSKAAIPTDSIRSISLQPPESENGQRLATPLLASPFLEELQALLETNYGNSRFGVEEMAQAMELSRVHLYRKIKAHSGLTASELLRNYRLTKATYLLKLGHTITETAFAVGFDSPAYFAKCFRDVYQLTPSDFQAQEKSRPKN